MMVANYSDTETVVGSAKIAGECLLVVRRSAGKTAISVYAFSKTRVSIPLNGAERGGVLKVVGGRGNADISNGILNLTAEPFVKRLQEPKDVDYFVYRKMKFPPEDLIDVEKPPFELLLTTKK
jgi:hypothetical protein